MDVGKIGLLAFVAATTALGALEALQGEPLPGLHQLPEATPIWLVRSFGALLAVASLLMLARPVAGLVVGALWFLAVGFALIGALNGDVFAWVPVAETAVFAAFAFWRCNEARGWLVLRILFGAMLVLFGGIHLAQREVIASLIPDWIPGAQHWPWLTGSLSVLAGIACLVGRGVSIGAGAIALMYASWLLLVHAPRLAATPSLFEWTFALTAVALAGVALAIAGGRIERA